MKNTINWFEIPVNDFDRAINFYEHIMDVQLQRENMDGIKLAIFPHSKDTVSGALVKADFLEPGAQGSVVYLNAEGIMDEVLERAQKAGSTTLLPKTDIGENGFIAHISDSEGNRVALHSMQS